MSLTDGGWDCHPNAPAELRAGGAKTEEDEISTPRKDHGVRNDGLNRGLSPTNGRNEIATLTPLQGSGQAPIFDWLAKTG